MNELRKKYVLIFGNEQSELLDRVYAYAERMHSGQLRDSGEPYIDRKSVV